MNRYRRKPSIGNTIYIFIHINVWCFNHLFPPVLRALYPGHSKYLMRTRLCSFNLEWYFFTLKLAKYYKIMHSNFLLFPHRHLRKYASLCNDLFRNAEASQPFSIILRQCLWIWHDLKFIERRNINKITYIIALILDTYVYISISNTNKIGCQWAHVCCQSTEYQKTYWYSVDCQHITRQLVFCRL